MNQKQNQNVDPGSRAYREDGKGLDPGSGSHRDDEEGLDPGSGPYRDDGKGLDPGSRAYRDDGEGIPGRVHTGTTIKGLGLWVSQLPTACQLLTYSLPAFSL